MMKTAATFANLAILLCSATAHSAVTFDWAAVGNPGNTGDLQPNGTFGAVSYAFRISKYEVTNAQYVEFLNAADPAGVNSRALYDSLMSTDANGGINFDAAAAVGMKYQIKSGRGNNPVIYVSFFDAMRFTNWLQNGQGSGSTESGVYAIGNGTNEIRSPSAAFFIPSEHEWYKAAYHKNDGATGNYWKYPTSTDTQPYSDQPPGTGAPNQANTVNYLADDGLANGYDDGLAVTGSTTFSDTQNYLTDVGGYAKSTSPYGTFDQGGNVYEWNEAVINVSSLFSARGVRGGAFAFSGPTGDLAASERGTFGPADYTTIIGFRIASKVPEPSTERLFIVGLLACFASSRQMSPERGTTPDEPDSESKGARK